MEVHHAHYPTHKKKWTEYFLEFFMLFFAVFLGFTAENIREHNIEKHRAKQFLEGYKNDLLQNQIIYKEFDSAFSRLLPVYDTITIMYHEKKEDQELTTLARLLYAGKRTINIPINTASYMQMVNSGSMRLIENKAITNAMNKYNAAIINFKEFDTQLKAVRGNIYPEVIKLEDLHDFFRFDPRQKTTLRNYIPAMDPFPVLKENERRILVSYYKLYISQTSAELNSLRSLNKQNDELLTMIE